MTEQPTTAPFNAADVLARLERPHRQSIEHSTRVENAWNSPEAAALRRFVQEDGNVDWREFVSHCGGILKTVELVDQNGDPDPERVVPLIDELFGKFATQEFAGGMTMTRKPNNRPFRKRGPSFEEQRAQFPGDSEGDAEALLRVEQEAAQRPRTTHPR